MIAAVETYLGVRRAAGFVLSNSQYLLRSFANFAAERQQLHIRTATVIDWASETVSVAQRHTRYRTVCRFASYLRLEDPQHESPPPNYFGYRKSRRVPHIYSRVEIDRLILAATQLPPADSLRPQTYATLISLLAATGLRISEALGLCLCDLTPNGLVIRKTKFQKTRLVPLHESSVAALARYLTCRRQAHPGGDHVFVCNDGQPLAYRQVHAVFGKLLKSADLLPSRGRAPRLHELRHNSEARIIPSAASVVFNTWCRCSTCAGSGA